MSQKPEIHAGDVGTELEVVFLTPAGLPFDISSATVREVNLQRPDGVSVVRSGTLTTDGTDGRMDYTTTTGDFPVPGYWHVQGRVAFADGTILHSQRIRVRVWPNNAAPA